LKLQYNELLSSFAFNFNLRRHNQAPTLRYERHVGSKVTFRLLNKKWAAIYGGAKEGRDVLLRVDPREATLVAGAYTRSHFRST
jgi:hypothetical protein